MALGFDNPGRGESPLHGGVPWLPGVARHEGIPWRDRPAVQTEAQFGAWPLQQSVEDHRQALFNVVQEIPEVVGCVAVRNDAVELLPEDERTGTHFLQRGEVPFGTFCWTLEKQPAVLWPCGDGVQVPTQATEITSDCL